MKILVVGAGMYVTGRGTQGLGTVIPAIAEWSRRHTDTDLTICATSEAGREPTLAAVAQTNQRLGTDLQCRYAIAETALSRAECFDCALVSVPDHLHAAIGRPLLKAGCHTLMVKPFTETMTEATELIDLQSSSGVYGAVEFHKRFDAQNLIVRRHVLEKTIGELVYATVEFSQRVCIPTEIFRGWANRTNVFQYLGVHYVDLLYFLTGYKPLRAMAVGTTGVLVDLGVDAFDSVHATVVWEKPNGREFISQFATNWIDPNTTTAMSDQQYKLIGEHGRFEVNQRDRGLRLIADNRNVESINPYFSQYLPDQASTLRFHGYGPDSILQFLDDVHDIRVQRTSVQDLEGHRPTFRAALVSVAVTQAVNQSLSDKGEWKHVDTSTGR